MKYFSDSTICEEDTDLPMDAQLEPYPEKNYKFTLVMGSILTAILVFICTVLYRSKRKPNMVSQKDSIYDEIPNIPPNDQKYETQKLPSLPQFPAPEIV